MVRTSVPASNRWTANACRKRMRCDRFGNIATSRRLVGTADSTVCLPTWLPTRSPGKSHPLGLSTRHQSRRISRSFGESMTSRSLGTLTLLDTDEHSLTVDIGDLQADRLRDAQSGGVAGGQDRAMLETPDTGQKLQNFLRTQDNRQLLRFLGRWNYFCQVPILVERDFVEETKSRYGDDNRARSELPFVG